MAYFTFFLIGIFKNVVLIILSCKCGKLCMEGKFAKFMTPQAFVKSTKLCI